MRKLSIQDIAKIGVLTSLMCVFSPISFPMQPIPMTLQPLMLSLIVLLLPFRHAVISIVIYLIIGALGFPVFSNYNSGFAHFFGVTGGFLFAFAVFPTAYNLFVKHNFIKNNFMNKLIGLALSHATLYALGALGMVIFLNVNSGNITPFYNWASTILVPYYMINIVQAAVAILISSFLPKTVRGR